MLKSKNRISTKLTLNSLQNPKFIILSDSTKKYSWEDLEAIAKFYTNIIVEKQMKKLVFYADRSITSVALIVACIKNNVTFVPISRDQPNERIIEMLNLISECEVFDPRENMFIKILENINHSDTNLEGVLYVLFTSGSTGSPKGVKISEDNLLNTLSWSKHIFDWHKEDIIGIVTPLYFDISIFDLLLALTEQISVYIFSQTANCIEFCQELKSSNVTSVFSTPSLFSNICSIDQANLVKTSSLRRIISGGDFFPTPDLIYWYKNFPELQIYNVWGPTETSIVNSAHKVTTEDIVRLRANKPISIGKSTAEMKIVLCAPNIEEVEMIKNDFEIGELLVQGKSVGMGYVNQDDLTQKSFITLFGERTYRTGDLGFTENGEIFMTSRDAHLIKYQGFRIDPREVETHIAKLNGAKNSCLILANRNTGNSELVLIIEQLPNFHLSISEIKIYLRNKIPAYMIPKKIVFFEEIPFNINGKLDRKSCQALYTAKYQK
jgi:acyl-CoA synthetase (AMP-forming)/AMP-acid ligase II